MLSLSSLLFDRLRQNILHSSVWLWLFKCYKFIGRRLFGRPSYLEQLCRQAIVSESSTLPGPAFPAYPFPMSYWWPGKLFSSVLGAIRRYRRLIIQSSNNSEGTDQDHPLLQVQSLRTPPRLPYSIAYQIDRSLLISTKLSVWRRQLESKETVDIYPIFQSIINQKRFPADGLPATPVAQILYFSLLQLHHINQLLYDLNERCQTRFDSTNRVHERRLYDLWSALCPVAEKPVPAERYSKEWQWIGFQGTDPATDFRGMGILGLEHLLHFSRRHQPLARETLGNSHDEQLWYSWAIVGINITAAVMKLFQARFLQLYLYSALENYYSDRYGITADNNESKPCEEWVEFLQRAGITNTGVVGAGTSLDNIPAQQRQPSAESLMCHRASIVDSGGSVSDQFVVVVGWLRDQVAELYSYLFVRFDRYWMGTMRDRPTETKNKPAILEFPGIFAEFKTQIELDLLAGRITQQSVRRYLSGV